MLLTNLDKHENDQTVINCVFVCECSSNEMRRMFMTGQLIWHFHQTIRTTLDVYQLLNEIKLFSCNTNALAFIQE